MEQTKDLIAPCGMDCRICASYLALKNEVKSKGIGMPYCQGCRIRDKKCAFLKKRCELLMKNKSIFCYECEEFPCGRLEAIDKRYRARYHMSMIENLEQIRDNGMEGFLKAQDKKWKCPDCKEMISCHNGICFNCGMEKLRDKKEMYRWEEDEKDMESDLDNKKDT